MRLVLTITTRLRAVEVGDEPQAIREEEMTETSACVTRDERRRQRRSELRVE